MTNEEIKKLLECYLYLQFRKCGEEHCECISLIAEQEQEIERLRNEKWNAQDDLDCYHSEIKDKIKQAKIEVLELLSSRLDEFVYAEIEVRPLIDELIANLKGE